MKKQFSLSLLVILLVASFPARADFLTTLMFDSGTKLAMYAVKGVVNTVKDAVVPKESPEERAAKEKADMDRAIDQVLAAYPEEQRAELRPKLVERMTLIYAQYKTAEARQEAIVAEQNSAGNVIASTVTSVVGEAIGNRMAIEAATMTAFGRGRF